MKLCIERIHIGRYKIDILDENNQIINGTDGGLALVMMWVTNYLNFGAEHAQYQRDQRASSNYLRDAVIKDIQGNPEKYLPPKDEPLDTGGGCD